MAASARSRARSAVAACEPGSGSIPLRTPPPDPGSRSAAKKVDRCVGSARGLATAKVGLRWARRWWARLPGDRSQISAHLKGRAGAACREAAGVRDADAQRSGFRLAGTAAGSAALAVDSADREQA